MMFSSLKKEAEKHKIEKCSCTVLRVINKLGVLSLTEVTEAVVHWIETRIVYVCQCVYVVCVCVTVCVCVSVRQRI